MTPKEGINLDSNLIDIDSKQLLLAVNSVRNINDSFRRNENGFLASERTYPTGTLSLIGSISIGADIAEFWTDDTVSEIGIYNPTLDTYTTKFNNTGLAFNKHYPIFGKFKYNFKGERIVSFSDNNNVPRIINIDDPTTTVDELRLFVNYTEADISATSQSSGGSLLSGTYYIIGQYKDDDLTETDYWGITQPIYITDDTTSTFKDYDGVEGGTSTSKAINLTITNVDTNFKFIKLIYISLINGVYTAKEFKTLTTQATIIISFTGNEKTTDLVFDNVIAKRIIYNKVGAIGDVSGRLAIGDLETESDINLQQVANEIVIDFTTSTVNPTDITTGFKGHNKQFFSKAFLHGEVYAFYLVCKLTDGTITKGFHIPGRAIASDEQFVVSGGDLIGGVGEVGKTRPYFSTLNGVSDMGTGFNTPYKYQIDDTSNNVLAISNMGYWENRNEFYPETDDFSNITADSSSTEFAGDKIRVRHHRFPTLRKSGLSAYTNSSVEILGIDVSNVNIPDELQDKIQSWEIYYAKRDYNNATIIGQDILLYAANPEFDDPGGSDTDKVWTTGGNFKIDNEERDFDQIFVDKSHLRIHSFDLLFNKPAIVPTYITCQFKMRRNNLTDMFDDDGGRISDGEEIWSYLIDYVNGSNRVISTVIDDNYFRVIQNRKYIPNNVIDLPQYNVFAEEYVDVELLGDDLGLDTSGVLTTHIGEATNTLSFEETMLININVYKQDIYDSFTSQTLCATGVKQRNLALTSLTDVFGGDTFVSQHSFITYAARYKQDIINPAHGVRIIHNLITQSFSNINLRYQTIGDVYSRYFPKSTIEDDDAKFPHTLHRDTNPELLYNKDYSALNDLIQVTPFDTYNETINKFPDRVHLSIVSKVEEKQTSWKTFLPFDYYEIRKNRGRIINLDNLDDDLLIHCEDALFVTRDKTTLKTDGITAILGSGDIFQFEPKEINYTKNGYSGTQHKFSCLVTPYGYFFVNSKLGKIFLYTGGDNADEISLYKLRNFSSKYLSLDKDVQYPNNDNPFTSNGFTVGYDLEEERIILACKNPIYTVTSEVITIPIYISKPKIRITLNGSTENSYIEFLLNEVLVRFDVKDTAVAITDIQNDTDNDTLASNFASSINAYLVANSIDDLYDVTVNLNVVTIESVQYLDIYNFGTVNINNITTVFEDTATASGGAGVSEVIYPILANDIVFFVDFQAFSVPDKCEIFVNTVLVATSNMNQFNTGGIVSSNYGYATEGVFDPTQIAVGGSITDSTGSWYIGSAKGSIPNRYVEFAADNTLTYIVTNQQLIWTTASIGDDVRVKISGPAGTSWEYKVIQKRNLNSIILLTSQLDNEVSSEDVTVYTSNKVDDKSFTLSYAPWLKQWMSLHTYRPDFIINNIKSIFSYNTNEIFLHNRGLKGIYYDTDTIEKCIYQVVYNEEATIEKIMHSISWKSETTLLGKTLYDETFTKIRVRTNTHCGELTTLISRTNCRKVKGYWNFNKFKDLLIRTDSEFETFIGNELEYFAIDETKIDLAQVNNNKRIIKSNYLVVIFEFDNADNKEIVFMDYIVNAVKAQR